MYCNLYISYTFSKLFSGETNLSSIFSCQRSRADLVVSFGVLVLDVHVLEVHVLVLEPLPLLLE